MYKEALILAAKAHAGQKRRNGNPYITHCIRVSQEVHGEKEKVVAILHDVLEDTSVTADELLHFGQEVVDAVVCITHRKGESYADYIARVKENDIATAVKIADIADNLSDSPSDHAINKSAKALDYLMS